MTIKERLLTRPGYRLLLIGLIFGLAGTYECREQTEVITAVPVETTQTFARMTSHVPASTVKAILANSERPRTLTAIASIETGRRGHVKSRGDSGKSRGVFQIQPRYWGNEGDTLEAQVRKCDYVFSELEKQYGYWGAVKAYNGSGAKAEAYRRKVYARLEGM